tara:strand:- start:399 stop:530 length:132 start_codon:yes stop_codon:yes gene_type:complete
MTAEVDLCLIFGTPRLIIQAREWWLKNGQVGFLGRIVTAGYAA